MWKWILVFLLVGVGGCVGTGVWLQSSGTLEQFRKQFDPSLKPTYVRQAKVERGTISRTISAPGLVEPRTRIVVSTLVSARIEELPFREGQVVRKGDVIVRLDDRDQVAALNAAKALVASEEARLEGSRATLANVTADLGRQRELFASKDVSRAALDSAEAEYARAQSQLRVVESSIENARANVERAQRNLDNTVITAPADATITRLDREVGELVIEGTQNNPAAVIMEMANLSDMIVRARIDEANVAPVKPGQPATIYINAYPNRTFRGTLERVELLRQVDRDGSAYFEAEVKLEVPEDVKIYSGLNANVDIQVEVLSDVLKVPTQAILDRSVEDLPTATTADSPHIDRNKKFARVVFQIRDGRAVAVPVTVGASDLLSSVVAGGLEEGATVIVGPARALLNLKDGQRVADESEQPVEERAKGRVAGR